MYIVKGHKYSRLTYRRDTKEPDERKITLMTINPTASYSSQYLRKFII